jgi:hypothetical protein
MIPLLNNHLAKVKALHKADLAQGHGEVYLPHALARKYPGTGREWGWQYVFPAPILRRIPAPGSSGAIMWMPAWSTKPSASLDDLGT